MKVNGYLVLLTFMFSILFITQVYAQSQNDTSTRPPVIDVHMHVSLGTEPVEKATSFFNSQLERMDSLNVRLAVINGVPDVLFASYKLAPDRLIPSLLFPCENGNAPNFGRPCFKDGNEYPDIDWVRNAIESDSVQAFGELIPQYLGLEPADASMMPYYELAEEKQIPVFIHMGMGPPFAAYEENPLPVKSPNYNSRAGNPLLMEKVLLKHKNLRVTIMHGGWPMVDEMIFMLYQHPNVYMDVGFLHYGITRAAFYHFLKRIVDAGFSNRIMFGSDGDLEGGINAILEADFLTKEEKENILCNNAARFLELNANICQ